MCAVNMVVKSNAFNQTDLDMNFRKSNKPWCHHVMKENKNKLYLMGLLFKLIYVILYYLI